MSEMLILLVVGGVLAGLVIDFCSRFVRPYWQMRQLLNRAVQGLGEHDLRARETNSAVTRLDSINTTLDFDERLLHLWTEFRHTLHAEQADDEFDDHGQRRVLRYRQTAPAEAYFSGRALVDVPLRTSYFKHLPGILTGLGIIGTFLGLIAGLAGFDISGDPDTVNASVSDLISSVRGAFFVSAAAITSAMIVTFTEKSALADLQRRVQDLQSTIDRMFDAGAGEDYLSSIASEAEKSATHLSHLKEGLVNELKTILEDLTERQIASQTQAAQVISTQISETLQTPLEAMRRTVERSLEDQQAVVAKLMDKSLETFAQRLEEVVGEKLTDAAEEVKQGAMLLREALVDAPQRVQDAVERVRAVLLELAAGTEPVVANVERIGVATERFAATIEQSTDTLDYAIERFRQLGTELASSLDAATAIAASLQLGADRAQGAASALDGTREHFAAASEALTSVVQGLDGVAARTALETAEHARLADAVQAAADQLERAQKDVDTFFKGLVPVLGETHDAFARGMSKTLHETNDSFTRHMADATTTLAGTVGHFKEFLAVEFNDSVQGLRKVLDEMAAPPVLDGATNGAGGS